MQQGMNPLLNTSPTSSSSSQIPFNPHSHIQFHDPIAASSSTDDFIDHMLSSIPPCSWSDLSETPPSFQDNHDESTILASKLKQHQISGATSTAAVAKLMLHQQLLMASRAGGVSQNDSLVDGSPFKSTAQGGDGRYNGFGGGSLAPTHLMSQQQFLHPQAQNLGGPAVMNQQQQAHASGSTIGGGGGAASQQQQQQQPKQRVRARRGQATDPHSIAERLRRERIAERMKALQELVPNANKTDKASMLDEIIDYVKFLQLQVKVLSMSRLGGAAAVAPLVADLSSEGGAGVECIQAGTNGNQTASSSDSITVTEHQVAKLMEEDMGSAMQYLQGKGLCLMPISLATAISTATCHGRNNHSNGEVPSSPNLSVLTVQSATIGNGISEGSVKDATSVSKP